MRTLLILIVCICCFPLANADTIRMMQYNLMYYTTSAPSGCNADEAYLDLKDENFKVIMQYAQPDVLCVNEIGSQSVYVDRFLDNVLNVDGVTHYASCPLTNFSGGSIANMLYYNTEKLQFHSYFYITTAYRDINAYKMYYRSNTLLEGDTVFITFLIAHLKAGGYDNNAEQRFVQVQRLMQRLEQIGVADNYVFSGDFNLTNSNEATYQHLINYPNSLYRFYDPIDEEGNWNNNSQYRYIHTQSTHTYSENGCYSTGGMDDRFDFILVSPYIYYGSKKVKSLIETYKALGQDGSFFNGSISADNSVVPPEVAVALYNGSDHLPVMLDFELQAELSIRNSEDFASVNILNPIDNQLKINLFLDRELKLNFELYTIDGRRIDSFSKDCGPGETIIAHPFNYPSAFYLLKISDSENRVMVRKLIKR